MMDEHRGTQEVIVNKRRVLVVEDEAINREILSMILKPEYDVFTAADGAEALQKLQANKDFISLILLDLIMPNVSGLEVLRRIRKEPAYQDIPVIVASADQSKEIECLGCGASDFILKPYPVPGVILARVRRTIELFERRKIIESTEHDQLTGLYNKEFFYSYATQFDQYYPNQPMDAIMLDINNFRMINERYGKSFADEVLRRVGEQLQEIFHEDGEFVCRRQSDTFLIYCPHREDYKAILDKASMGLAGELDANHRIRLRMGVYSNADKSIDIERRFDRAKMAADTVRNSYTRNIAVYDDTLHNAELYSMQLIEDFPAAIEQRQFKVYFQPKFDIKPDKPALCGAEALVRWFHPELNMVSPGVFIPLFEENGLIEALDHYVWREAARQIHDWKERFGFSVPVSVNVSRVDLNDPDMVYLLLGIVEENQLEVSDLHLEITESAYAEDTEQIIEIVKRLRGLGFLVEMDDFGTGYSSLNMLSTLPIDVLKLDMKFIQTAFAAEKNTDMLAIIINIARHISAPVVAEGVETEPQLEALKKIGCDIVQGYYFSPPVPAEKFESFLIEKQAALKSGGKEVRNRTACEAEDKTPAFLKWGDRFVVSMREVSIISFVLALLAALVMFGTDSLVYRQYDRMDQANDRYILARQAARNLEVGSDELTADVRSFAYTGNMEYLKAYFKEVEVTRSRDKAIDDMKMLMQGSDSSALEYISTALSYSNVLMRQEYRAMNLILSLGGYDEGEIPKALLAFPISEEDKTLSPAEKKALALRLVYDDTYMTYKERIKQNTEACSQELLEFSDAQRLEAKRRMNVLMILQFALSVLLLLIVLLIILFIYIWIYRPLHNMVAQMRNMGIVKPAGATELRFVSETYNSIFEENRKTHERLTYGNMHDALTGLYNRNAYNFMKYDLDMSHNALLLVDVDKFKSVNDTYGHDVGDLVLKRVADVLKYSFRSSDLVFRLGGDEFVVIMTNVSSNIREQVRAKVEQANMMLQKPTDDLPQTSLSVGVAFADRENPEGDIFKDADTALYRMKEAGRCGCYIY